MHALGGILQKPWVECFCLPPPVKGIKSDYPDCKIILDNENEGEVGILTLIWLTKRLMRGLVY